MRRPYSVRTSEFSFTYEQAARMNIKFARAMFAARARGLEKFVIRVFTTDKPMRAVHFERATPCSFMSSSAGACVDIIPAESLPDRLIPSVR